MCHHVFTAVVTASSWVKSWASHVHVAYLEKTPGPLGWQGIAEEISRGISLRTVQFFLADIHTKYEEV